LAVDLAKKFGYEGEDLENIRRGALIHDIGKMAIPDNILQSTDEFTQKEEKEMHKHPLYAEEMLGEIEFLQPAMDIPKYHHERWDGTGYPNGLEGEEIPLPARIFAVVDVWDALLSARHYGREWSEKEACDYIKENSGKMFDPQVVEEFVKMMCPPKSGGTKSAKSKPISALPIGQRSIFS
jgi:HD-GYP domain-containing protein (c-di-GMP phosphodiesterase class II)